MKHFWKILALGVLALAGCYGTYGYTETYGYPYVYGPYGYYYGGWRAYPHASAWRAREPYEHRHRF